MKLIGYCPNCGGTRLRSKGKDVGLNGRLRYHCNDCGRRTRCPLKAPPVDPQVFLKKLPKAGRYVVTSAQNATKVNKPFLASLLAYCAENSAQLVVIPLRYKNPTSLPASQHDHWWADELSDYLFDGRGDLNENVTILGDIKMQPTASDPLSGMGAISGHRSAIIGHPKIALNTIPAPSHRMPKVIVTTGSITRPNYTKSKAGKKGEFHHSYGATVVEIAGPEVFFIRQINAARDGSFIDMEHEYTKDGVYDAPYAAGLVMGDIHATFIDPKVKAITFGAGGIIDTMKPKTLVWNDTLDCYSVSHHHKKNPMLRLAKHKSGHNDALGELKKTVGLMEWASQKFPGMRNLVIPSNHDEALARWIADTDWRDDLANAEFYLETALAMARGAKMGDSRAEIPDPFYYWAERLFSKAALRKFKFLKRGDSEQIADIEVGYHGDKGPGGSRGSAQQYRNIGAKSIIGHSHTPRIVDGCYQVGTSSRLLLDYNIGPPQTWLHCHCIIYANGKRSLLIMVGGRVRK